MIRFIIYIVKISSLVLIIPITNYNIDFHSSKKFNTKFVKDLIANDSLTVNSNVSEFEIVKKRIGYDPSKINTSKVRDNFSELINKMLNEDKRI